MGMKVHVTSIEEKIHSPREQVTSMYLFSNLDVYEKIYNKYMYYTVCQMNFTP